MKKPLFVKSAVALKPLTAAQTATVVGGGGADIVRRT